MQKAHNDIRAGIAAVQARLQTGRLKVGTLACPNTIAESGLYRYPTEGQGRLAGEVPIDQDNHAIAAMRYSAGWHALRYSEGRAEPALASSSCEFREHAGVHF